MQTGSFTPPFTGMRDFEITCPINLKKTKQTKQKSLKENFFAALPHHVYFRLLGFGIEVLPNICLLHVISLLNIEKTERMVLLTVLI